MKEINFKASVKVSASINDLIELGWSLESDGDDEKYHVDIVVNDKGKTSWQYTNTQKQINGIWEGSDSEPTGDDEATIGDLEKLYKEGKLWNIETEYYGA